MPRDLKITSRTPRRVAAVHNTRDLRIFLLDTMVGVVNETLTPGQAQAVCNVAQQIYNTLMLNCALPRPWTSSALRRSTRSTSSDAGLCILRSVALFRSDAG